MSYASPRRGDASPLVTQSRGYPQQCTPVLVPSIVLVKVCTKSACFNVVFYLAAVGLEQLQYLSQKSNVELRFDADLPIYQDDTLMREYV